MKRTFQFDFAEETEAFAQMISLWARPGQIIKLSGDLGSGKSTFARALIKSLANTKQEFDVPSPSFSIIQIYDCTRVPVAHIDLYRLANTSQIAELGVVELLPTHLAIVEWPELLGETMESAKLSLHFSGSGQTRHVKLEAEGAWIDQLHRNDQIEKFMSTTAWRGASRTFLEGDASSRRYETVIFESKSAILMDMPQRPDGPPVKNGKAYSAIAHLAENITAVVVTNKLLKSMGYSSPVVEEYNLLDGLAIIENLGNLVFGQMMRDGHNMREPMTTAVAVLADMAQKSWPSEFNNPDIKSTPVQHYDVEAQLIEVDLLVSWFWPYIHETLAPEELHQSSETIWRDLLKLAQPEKPHLVLRDFHSPNLIWIPERKGLKRVGIIDTQDCLLGHEAYDLASLLQDARFDIEFEQADELYAHYVKLRIEQGPFDLPAFDAAYAVLGAQRATKILGIFARLAKRDGKPSYLKHIPRVSRYLARNLEHQSLVSLKQWFDENLPEALTMGQS